MPQLDTYVFFTQVFWLLVTFLSLFFLCTSIFLPRILSSLVARSTLISLVNTAESVKWENKFDSLLYSLTPPKFPIRTFFLYPYNTLHVPIYDSSVSFIEAKHADFSISSGIQDKQMQSEKYVQFLFKNKLRVLSNQHAIQKIRYIQFVLNRIV